MIGCLALANLLALSAAFWAGGWLGVGALLLAELLVSVIGGVVLVAGVAALSTAYLSGREDPSERRIRQRSEQLNDERDHPWRDPR